MSLILLRLILSFGSLSTPQRSSTSAPHSQQFYFCWPSPKSPHQPAECICTASIHSPENSSILPLRVWSDHSPTKGLTGQRTLQLCTIRISQCLKTSTVDSFGAIPRANSFVSSEWQVVGISSSVIVFSVSWLDVFRPLFICVWSCGLVRRGWSRRLLCQSHSLGSFHLWSSIVLLGILRVAKTA